MKWTIVYYNKKVRAWINDMPIGMKAYYARITERLIVVGPNLGMPFTKVIERGLFELRIRGQEGISRIFYCTISGERIIMLHGFIKKSQKIPKKELKIARVRMREVIYE